MWRYLGRRLIQVPLVLLVVSLMTFLITRATPGDPVQIMLGMQTSKEAADAMRAEFNLDRPLPVQYGLWIAKVVRGDLGRSIRLNDPVTTLLAERFPVSLQLATAGMVFALLVSIPARRAGGAADATPGSTISVPATPWRASPSPTSGWRCC
jgi:peptide/nickel transport system permease protein